MRTMVFVTFIGVTKEDLNDKQYVLIVVASYIFINFKLIFMLGKHKNCSIIINRRGKTYCNSTAAIINK
jgi:hypothetical protein